MTIQRPRLLLIDSYDSFAFNLAALFRIAIPSCSIYIIQNDQLTIHELLPFLKAFSAIVIGPGPGSPALREDIGIVKDIWTLAEQDLLPIFGVCLGFQSLVIEHGGELRRLQVVKHGQLSDILHSGKDIFQNFDKLTAVRYHSLHAVPHSKEIEPLAWSDDGTENGKVLMAARHRTRPFWGVQYHPESVLTDEGGLRVLQNFWKLADEWSRERNRRPCALDLSLIGHPWPHLESPTHLPSHLGTTPPVLTSVIELPGISVVDICEMLGVNDHSSPFILLDSAANPGRFSIVASLLPTSLQILYSIGDGNITLKRGKNVTFEPLAGIDIWSWISRFMQQAEAKDGNPDVPFWGGLIGTLSYELGVHSLDVPLRFHRRDSNPHYDLNLIHVERSLVLDTSTEKVYIQSLLSDDSAWIKDSTHKLQKLFTHMRTSCSPSVHCASVQVKLPDRSRYISRIENAQDFLRSGDSYELCLTAHTLRSQIPF